MPPNLLELERRLIELPRPFHAAVLVVSFAFRLFGFDLFDFRRQLQDVGSPLGRSGDLLAAEHCGRPAQFESKVGRRLTRQGVDVFGAACV